MRYFTKEIWLGWQGEDWREWNELYEANLKTYRKQLASLSTRMPPKYFKFFMQESLHDGKLVSINIVNKPAFRSVVLGRRWIDQSEPIAIEIQVANSVSTLLFTLKYQDVRTARFDFPSDRPLFHPDGRIGTWGYDELTAADDLYLRHEAMFDSGAILLMEFRRFSYKRARIARHAHPA